MFIEKHRCRWRQDSGRHWVEWYDRTQLKPRSGNGGLHRSMASRQPISVIKQLRNGRFEVDITWLGDLKSSKRHEKT